MSKKSLITVTITAVHATGTGCAPSTTATPIRREFLEPSEALKFALESRGCWRQVVISLSWLEPHLLAGNRYWVSMNGEPFFEHHIYWTPSQMEFRLVRLDSEIVIPSPPTT